VKGLHLIMLNFYKIILLKNIKKEKNRENTGGMLKKSKNKQK